MTRYFYVTTHSCCEIDPDNIPNDACCRGWKNNKLASVLARYGRGNAFEPMSDLPAKFRRNIKLFIERYPEPAYNVDYSFATNQATNREPFNFQDHLNRITEIYD